MIELIQPGRRMGVINVPASKSDAQRAILVAALVPDTSRVYNYGSSDDVKAMISCIQELGAICSLSEDFIEIRGLIYSQRKSVLIVVRVGCHLGCWRHCQWY